MKFLEKVKEMDKKVKIAVGSGVAVGIVFGFVIAPVCSDSSHDGVEASVSKLEAKVEEQKTELSRKDTHIAKLDAKLDEAKPWFELKREEQKAMEAEQERLKAEAEAQKKAQEEEAKRQAEAELKKGYDTGITYGQLARTPDEYTGKKVKFSGKVVQVMEGDGEVQIRLAVGGDYDNIMYGAYDSSIVSARVLENDQITIMGMSAGLLSYKSTMGGTITIPSMLIEKIDQ